jgi:SP family arabinose:H+ symporter-like MFS transporter
MTGSVGMAVSLLALIGMLAAGQLTSGLLLLPIVCFTGCFATCIRPVFWTLAPEIFPNKVRGRCMIVPVITQWVTNALVILFFPVAFNRRGKIPTFGFRACMCVGQAVFTWLFLPETKGKTLEENRSPLGACVKAFNRSPGYIAAFRRSIFYRPGALEFAEPTVQSRQ